VVIQVRALTYSYPRSSEPALHDVELEAAAGEFCALLGANGAGKSTLCYALSGLIPHFYRGTVSGSVEVAGHDVLATPLAALAGDVGLVFANPFNQITGARFSVREEIAFGLESLGIPRAEMLARVDRILERTGLGELAERSPYALSGGQQQRLAIASVLVMQPKVLILDEPTSQLDPAGTRDVFELLHDLASAGDTTIILAEHKTEWVAAFADRVIVLEAGAVISQGQPAQVLADVALSEKGVNLTRYTLLAQQALKRGLVAPAGRLPVTLEQAKQFFQ
jgi:energy-coupling factor transport system ATP-binding protein